MPSGNSKPSERIRIIPATSRRPKGSVTPMPTKPVAASTKSSWLSGYSIPIWGTLAAVRQAEGLEKSRMREAQPPLTIVFR